MIEFNSNTEFLENISTLLDQLYLTEWPGSVDTFLLLGYKKLSPGAKETYQILRNLAIANKNSGKSESYTCKVSYEFLAIALNTTCRTQINRIQSLIKNNIISKVTRAKSSNLYTVIVRPLPDYFFEITIRKLILRRECLNIYINLKDNSLGEEQKIVLKNRLEILFKSPFCREIILKAQSPFTEIASKGSDEC